MNNQKYEKYWTFGWEVAGPIVSAIRNKASECNCKLDIIKVSMFLRTTVLIKAEGGQINDFTQFMNNLN